VERIAACFYPLESLEVTMSDTEEFTVNGHDEVAIENFADADVGALIYTLEIETENPQLGEDIVFSIKPANPGIVHAQVQYCTVTNVEKQQTVRIFGARNFCRNGFINFQIVSGFGSMEKQTFSYSAFRWSTNSDESPILESHQLSCHIELQAQEFEEVNSEVCY